MAGHGRPWPARAGNGQPWRAMAGGQPWPSKTSNVQPKLAMVGQCRPWPSIETKAIMAIHRRLERSSWHHPSRPWLASDSPMNGHSQPWPTKTSNVRPKLAMAGQCQLWPSEAIRPTSAGRNGHPGIILAGNGWPLTGPCAHICIICPKLDQICTNLHTDAEKCTIFHKFV